MTPEALQLGGVVAVVIAFIELLKFVINKYSPAQGGVYGGKVDLEIGKLVTKETRNENDIVELKTNHLKHQEAIIEDMKENAKQHQEIFITLTRIEGKVDNLSK